jgi:hypothetical protein
MEWILENHSVLIIKYDLRFSQQYHRFYHLMRGALRSS